VPRGFECNRVNSNYPHALNGTLLASRLKDNEIIACVRISSNHRDTSRPHARALFRDNGIFCYAAHWFVGYKPAAVLLRPPVVFGCRNWTVACISGVQYVHQQVCRMDLDSGTARVCPAGGHLALNRILFHSSIVEHFFTADCQIQTWREIDFASRCGDKLFLMQLVVGTCAYSAGAAIQHIVKLRHRPDPMSSSLS
jgi:hypothetical protein